MGDGREPDRAPSWAAAPPGRPVERLAGKGEALVKEGFLEEGGQSRHWKEGRDRVTEKERKSSAGGERPVGGRRKYRRWELHTLRLRG